MHISLIDDDGEIPAAYRIVPHLCKTWPELQHIHIMLIDESGLPIAQATVNKAMLDRWQRVLDGTEKPGNEELEIMGITQEESDH